MSEPIAAAMPLEEASPILEGEEQPQAVSPRQRLGPLLVSRPGLLGSLVALAALVLCVVGFGFQGNRTLVVANSQQSVFLADKKTPEEVTEEMLEKQEEEAEKKVADMREKAMKDMAAAEEVEKKAQKEKEDAEATIKKADATIEGALKDIQNAKDMDKKANQNIDKAGVIEKKSKEETDTAAAVILKANRDIQDAKAENDKAQQLQAVADKKMDAVKALEQKAFDKVAENRICMDLPGAELRPGDGVDDFNAIAVKRSTGTPEECTAWCKEHEDCTQAVFYGGDKQLCSLFKTATSEVNSFWNGVNSSYCGEAGDEKKLKGMIKEVFDKKPYVPEPVDCSWDGEDCSGTKCCNDQKCEWDFSSCKGYTCFKAEEGAKCMEECYGDCTTVGGPRETREIEKAKEGWLTTGMSLYCILAVNWGAGSEADLANNQKEKKVGIYQCDDQDIIEVDGTAKTDWATYINVDAFVDFWKKVQKAGKLYAHDWVVKTEADVVFFPDVLKKHLGALGTPQGSRVYLKNTNHKFQFLGALEVFTREAVQLFFEKGWVCEQKDHGKQGEDYYMQYCMDSIGVDHQTDFALLADRRAASASDTKQYCTDGWVAAYHWHRSVDGWNKCHDEALDAQAKAGGAGDAAASEE